MPPPSPLPLLAAQADASPIGSMLTWSAVLLVLIVVAFLAYAQLKRWMAGSDDAPADGFTFSGLRELHRQGKLSDGEYEVARNQLALSTQKAAGSLPDPLARPAGRAAAGAAGTSKLR